jgi:peptidoglycan hydrolase CwlO-like protein
MDTSKTDNRFDESRKAIKPLTAGVKILEQEIAQLKKKIRALSP